MRHQSSSSRVYTTSGPDTQDGQRAMHFQIGFIMKRHRSISAPISSHTPWVIFLDGITLATKVPNYEEYY